MPKFAANLSMLFTELPFMERFAAAKAAGFEAVEYLFPYAFDKSELVKRRQALVMRGLAIVFAGLLLLAAIAIAIAESAAHPVKRLVAAVSAMSNGQFDTRVKADSSGEFGFLERGFNEMATHIEDVHHSMQERIEEATSLLAFQARHDSLTGLLNRREFEQRLEKARYPNCSRAACARKTHWPGSAATNSASCWTIAPARALVR